jgi:hypothetical protein
VAVDPAGQSFRIVALFDDVSAHARRCTVRLKSRLMLLQIAVVFTD